MFLSFLIPFSFFFLMRNQRILLKYKIATRRIRDPSWKQISQDPRGLTPNNKETDLEKRSPDLI